MRDRFGGVAAGRTDLGVIGLVVVRVDVRRAVGQVQFEDMPGPVVRSISPSPRRCLKASKKVKVAMAAAPYFKLA